MLLVKMSKMTAMRNRGRGVEDAIGICKAREAPQPKPGCNRAGIVRQWHWVMEGSGEFERWAMGDGGPKSRWDDDGLGFQSIQGGTVQQYSLGSSRLGAVCGQLDPSPSAVPLVGDDALDPPHPLLTGMKLLLLLCLCPKLAPVRGVELPPTSARPSY